MLGHFHETIVRIAGSALSPKDEQNSSDFSRLLCHGTGLVEIPSLIFDLSPNLFSQAVPCARQEREGGANNPRQFPGAFGGKGSENWIENGVPPKELTYASFRCFDETVAEYPLFGPTQNHEPIPNLFHRFWQSWTHPRHSISFNAPSKMINNLVTFLDMAQKSCHPAVSPSSFSQRAAATQACDWL